MGWLDLFRTRRTVTAARKGKRSAPRVSETLRSVQTDIDQLQSRVGTIDIAIKRHEDQLTAHETRLQEYAQRFQTLEQKVALPAVQPMTFREAGRHATENNARLFAQSAHAIPARQFDIEQFTEQQKRLLAVFFQNKGQWMSYADLGRILNKSAYTVKNQMNQIRQKADLFDCTIGSQSRNLFALKADLRVEKYLKVGQPTERPVSMPQPDPSDHKEAEPVVEYAHERSEPDEEG